ncbi:MAG: hypothetical protein IKX63_05905 [Muribaculaceae bacterium]|nr:hypothetical protein [Muribaculaceae bacterium]
MKQFFTILLLAVLLTSCTNTSTVNILISNSQKRDVTMAEVKVPLDDILKHLDAQITDTLYLLNEKNQPVDYRRSAANDSIIFTVPIIKQYSQKNYSIHTSSNQLSDNLFKFRTASINVEL